MPGKITPLPVSFVSNVMVDARAKDVNISVDPAMIFTSPVEPGKIIPDDAETGVAVIIQKGSALMFSALLENDKAAELVEALVTCMVRGDPNQLERAEGLLARIERAITTGLESPAYTPWGKMPDIPGIAQANGDDNAQTKNQQRRVDDRLPGRTQDDSS